eukprot:m.122903 g.122903  ORF g.122903 m.122903 type:complete len:109 (+) comp15557_c0_seq2:1802-2128(+)
MMTVSQTILFRSVNDSVESPLPAVDELDAVVAGKNVAALPAIMLEEAVALVLAADDDVDGEVVSSYMMMCVPAAAATKAEETRARPALTHAMGQLALGLDALNGIFFS